MAHRLLLLAVPPSEASSKLKPVIVIGIPVVALVLGGTLFYLGYTRHQERYFADEYMRAIGVLAEQIGEGISARRNAIESATERRSSPEQLATRLGMIASASVDVVPEQQCRMEIVAQPAVRQTSLAPRNVLATATSASGSVLQIRVGDATGDPPETLCLRFVLTDIIDPLVATGPLAAMGIFLADTEGRVLYQRDSNGVRIVQLANTGAALAPDGAADGGAPNGLPPLAELLTAARVAPVTWAGVMYTFITHPVTGRLALRGDVPVRWVVGAYAPAVQLAQRAHSISYSLASVVPFALVLGILMLGPLRVIMMGPRDRLTAQYVHFLGICIVSLTALAAVSILDVYFYRGLSETLDRQMEDTARELIARFEEETTQAHATLVRFVESRVADTSPFDTPAAGQISRVLCSGLFDPAGPRCNRCSDDHGAPSCRRLSDEHVRSAGSVLATYPDFVMVTITDPDGIQREKWTPQAETTVPIKVTGVSSFTDTQGRWLLRFAPGRDGKPAAEGVLTVMRSPTTAATLTIFSIPVQYIASQREDVEPASARLVGVEGTSGARPATVGVASMVLDLDALVDPPIVPDFQFAVVERGGRVLFHSDENRRLYENFFDESSSGGAALQAAVFASQTRTLHDSYHGRPHRMHITPLPHTPWSLIVLRDKELQRTLSFEIGVTASVLLVGYVLAYLCVALASAALWPSDRTYWLWPRRELTAVYWRCALVIALLAGCLGWMLLRHGSVALAWVAVLAPVAGIALVFLALSLDVPMHLARKIAGGVLLVGATALLVAKAADMPTDGAAHGVGVLVLLIVAGTALIAAAPRSVPSRRPHTQAAYVALGMAMLTLVAVIPAVTVFKDGFEQGIETLARVRQLNFAERLALHAHQKRQSQPWTADPVWTQTHPAAEVLPYPTGWFRDDTPCEADAPCESRAATDEHDGPWAALRHFTSLVAGRLPVYSEETREVREMLHAHASDRRWHWTGCPPDPHRDGWADFDLCARPLVAASTLATQLVRWPLPGSSVTLVFIAVGALCMVVMFLALREVAQRVFGVHVEFEPAAVGTTRETECGRILLRPERALVEWLRAEAATIDFRELTEPADWQARVSSQPAARAWLLDHFEHRIDEPEWNRAKLALLEQLVLRTRHFVVIVSAVDPLSYLERRLKSPGDPADESYVSVLELERWAAVLASFAKLRSDLPLPPARPELAALSDAEFEDVLRRECTWTPRLRAIADDVRRDPRCRAHGREQLIRHIGDLAEAHYRLLWSMCTDFECLQLFHLAYDGYVNPHSWDVVRRLARRSLVRRDPAFRIMNESFARFVRGVEKDATIRRWESAAGPSVWDWMRTGAIGVAVIAGAVMFFTQPDTLDKGVGLATALTGASGAALQLFNLFRDREPAARS